MSRYRVHFEYDSTVSLLQDCDPINGGWSSWSRWSACSKRCGAGSIQRTRTCTQPEPKFEGRKCQGVNIQKRKCYLRRCSLSPAPQPGSSVDVAEVVVDNAGRVGADDHDVAAVVVDNAGRAGADDPDVCHLSPPYLKGFLGPFATAHSSVENPQLRVAVGKSIFYKCAEDKVLDVRTNQRYLAVRCTANETFSFPSGGLECQQPKHCIGPVHPKYRTVPSRDPAVNSAAWLVCGEGDTRRIGSCFPDGVYRLPGEGVVDPCIASGEMLQECHTTGQRIVLGEKDFGWIQFENEQPETPANKIKNASSNDEVIFQENVVNPLHVVSGVFETLLAFAPRNGTAPVLLPNLGADVSTTKKKKNCSYILEAPLGFAVRLGIEKMSHYLRVRDLMLQEQVTIHSTFDMREGVIRSKGNVVKIDLGFSPGGSKSFKLNYQVFQP